MGAGIDLTTPPRFRLVLESIDVPDCLVEIRDERDLAEEEIPPPPDANVHRIGNGHSALCAIAYDIVELRHQSHVCLNMGSRKRLSSLQMDSQSDSCHPREAPGHPVLTP